MSRLSHAIAAVLTIAILGAAAWLWHERRQLPPPIPAPPPAAPVAAPPPAAPAASAPLSRWDAGSVPADAPQQPATVESVLTHVFGRKAVLSFFQLDDFPRRLVATVDNLARSHASPRLWPMNPAEGRFTVQTVDGQEVISPDNGLRYTPYVLLLETVDMRQAAGAYRTLYPLFQQAYQDQGYPNAYFNDRLVEVIDHLLATPEPSGQLAVRMSEIKGPVQPERPWVLYEFADPDLQSLSAGQRLLLRMGPVNERRVKAKLEEIRRLVAAAPATR
jgi:hypothetical protein